MPAERPNVWLILCDQLRADALGCYGHPFVSTPVIDDLAAGGVVFDRAYTPSPVCVPARASLLTGDEPQRTDCFENGWPMPDVPTFADDLAEAGYRTHGVGKMHFTPDPFAGRGLQTRDVGEEFGEPDTDDYLSCVEDGGFGHVERPLGLRDEMYYVPQLSPVPEGLHHSHWVADASIAFADRARSEDRPFLLFSSFIAPHPPFAPPSPWHRLYDPSSMPDPHRPAGEDGLLTAHQRVQNRYKYRDGGDDRRLQQLIMAYYLASVSHLDAQVGRVRDALARSGQLDDTLIVLTSDHGEFLGDYGCWGKRSFLDSAARVPMICRGPGFTPGRSATPVSLTDVRATLRRAAGFGTTAPSEDSNAEPLHDLTRTAERRVFGQYQHGDLATYAVIEPRWTYLWSAVDRREILLDRRHDPRQTRNHAYQPRARLELERLRAVAVEHFDGLSELGVDGLDALSENRPLQLGHSVADGGADGYHALRLDPDAATLVVGVGPQTRPRTAPPTEPSTEPSGSVRTEHHPWSGAADDTAGAGYGVLGERPPAVPTGDADR